MSSPRALGGRNLLSLVALAVCTLTVQPGAAGAQEPPTPSPTVAATPTPTPALTPAEVPARALTGRELVRELHPLATASDDATVLEQVLVRAAGVVERARRSLEPETTRTMSRRNLEDLRAEIVQLRARAQGWQNDLGERSLRVGTGVARVSSELTTWEATRRESWFSALPRELTGQVSEVEDELHVLERELEKRLGRLLELQTRLSDAQASLELAQEGVDAESAARARDMLSVDAPPLWRVVSAPSGFGLLGGEVVGALRNSFTGARTYVGSRRNVIAAQGLAWILLVGILEVSQRRRRWDDDASGPAVAVLRRPLAASSVLVLTVGQFLLHRDAPSAWLDLVSLLILVSATRLLPVLLPPPMRPVLRGLAVIAGLHWLAYLVSERLVIDRLLWLLTSLVGAVFLPKLGSWTLDAVAGSRPRLAVAERALARVCAAGLAAACLANLVGFFTLATTITNGALLSVYLSVLMWTLTEIVDGLVLILLRSGLGRRMRMLRDHGGRVRATVARIAAFLAVAGWMVGTATEIGLLAPVLRIAKAVLAASATVGQLTLSAGSVLLFALILWFTFRVSRLVRFILAEEVVARVDLPQGVPAALSTLTHYAVVVIGVLVAIAAIGLNLTNIALVVGALSVGIGFGLQTVVNNFVSGLILLFERPIRVDDKIQLDQMAGTVTAIGIRASRVRTWEGAEVVIPNGSLLESQLINWTLSDPTRRVEARVGVAYGTDPEQVLSLLVSAAETVPKVLSEPSPMALFVGFGDSSLDFSLRAWCDFADTVEVSSELHVAVERALREAGIEIPFPQRDLHVRTVPPDLGGGGRERS